LTLKTLLLRQVGARKVFSIVDVRAYHVGQQEAYSDQVTVTEDEDAVRVQPGGSHDATDASRSSGPELCTGSALAILPDLVSPELPRMRFSGTVAAVRPLRRWAARRRCTSEQYRAPRPDDTGRSQPSRAQETSGTLPPVSCFRFGTGGGTSTARPWP
jgi:hypothetical protein